MRWIVLGAVAAVVVAAAPAGAATFCVSDPACVLAGGTSEPDLQTALSAAIAASGADTVQLGPGRYSAATGFAAGDGSSAIAVVGAGRDQTTLTATTAASTVLDFGVGLGPGHDATVSDLTIAMPPSGGQGVDVPQHIARVTIAGGTGASIALRSQNTDVSDVTIALPLDGSDNEGIYRPNGTLTADGLSITAHTAITGNGSNDAYKHLRVVSDGAGISLGGSNAAMTIDDAQIRMTGAGTALSWQATFGTPSSLTARFLTIQGDGTAGSTGVAAFASTSASSVARLDLEDSIVAGFAHPLSCTVASSARAFLTVRWSDVPTPGVSDGCGGGIDTRTGNVSADPQLQSASNGDLLLAAGSPAIDAGDPALTSPSPATDLAGNARLVDGEKDGVARVDMGAFEYAPPPPPPISLPSRPGPILKPRLFTITKFAISPARFAPTLRGRAAVRRRRHAPHRGAVFSFRVSFPATVAIRVERVRRGRKPQLVRTLRASCRAGACKVRFDGRNARGHALAPGRYHALIAARAAGGARATARAIAFTILAG